MSKRFEVLIRELSQATDEAVASAVAEHRITARQHTVLRILRDVHDVTQNDLVHVTSIDRSTMADLLRRLERRGLVTRKRRKSDARAYNVNITKDGLSILEALGDSVAERVGKLLKSLTPREEDSLIKMLARVLSDHQDAKQNAA